MPPLDPWSARQRRGLIIVFSVVIVVLAIRLSFNRQTVTDPQPAAGPSAGQLADRLDPNVASAAELAAIPTLGERRAQAITDFRDSYVAKHPGRLAFGRLDDLLAVKGIGSATLETLEPYLIFPVDSQAHPSAPATRSQL